MAPGRGTVNAPMTVHLMGLPTRCVFTLTLLLDHATNCGAQTGVVHLGIHKRAAADPWSWR